MDGRQAARLLETAVDADGFRGDADPVRAHLARERCGEAEDRAFRGGIGGAPSTPLNIARRPASITGADRRIAPLPDCVRQRAAPKLV